MVENTELMNGLKEAAQTILNDIDKDTKASAKRVRKATLQIAKLGKEYRKLTTKAE